MHKHVQILYKIGLTAYLSIELSCSFPLSWFLSKSPPALSSLPTVSPFVHQPRTCLSESPLRHSSLRVPALSGLYSRYSLECSSMWVDCIIELCNVDHEYDDSAKFDSTVMTVCIIAVWKGNVYVRYRTSFG